MIDPSIDQPTQGVFTYPETVALSDVNNQQRFEGKVEKDLYRSPQDVNNQPVPPHNHDGINSPQITYGDVLNSPASVPNPLTVDRGGTGATTLTGVLIGNGTGAVTTNAPLSVANGGTGDTNLTNHYVLVGQGTGSVLPITPSTAGYILTSNGTSADPSFQANNTLAYSNGRTTRQLNAASATVNVAHNLGKTPLKVRVTAIHLAAADSGANPNVGARSWGVWDGSGQGCLSYGFYGGASFLANSSSNIVDISNTANANDGQTASMSVDGTNLGFIWTKTGSPSDGTSQIYLLWEAEG